MTASAPGQLDQVCVVIPAYGPAPHLDAILQRLAAGTFQPRRVVVSHSGPGGLAPPPAWPDSVVLTFLHSDARLYAGAARNRGAASAGEAILVFCDSDVLPATDWLERIVGALTARPDRFVVGSVGMAKTGGYWGVVNWLCEFSEQAPWRGPRPQIGGASCNLAIRRVHFDRVGGFPEQLRTGQDTALFHALRQSGLEQWFAPEAQVGHFNHAGLIAMTRHQWMHGRAFVRLRRQMDLPGRSLVRHSWLAPLLPLAKLVRILGRVLEGSPTSAMRRLPFVPGVVVGVLCWGAGVVAEAVSGQRGAKARA